jgi:thioredoxin 1
MVKTEFGLQKNLANTLKRGVALIDFNAPWCAPCRAQDPIIAKLEESYFGRACIAKVNIDKNRDIAMKLGIQSIPTIILFKEGKEINRFIGLQTAETLSGAIDVALAE